MANITIVTGILLIALGVVGYVVTGMVSITALIPAIPGVILLVLGLVARNPAARKHAMHAAAALALLGAAGTISGVAKVVKWILAGDEPARPAAAISQSVMAAVLIVFVALCIKSFVDARRNRSVAS